MVVTHPTIREEEATNAAWEALQGGAYGAGLWGIGALAMGAVGMRMSPVYRGLTIQFKVYIQMSAMIFGGMLEADSRLRLFEQRMRRLKKEEVQRRKREQYISGNSDDWK